jgi:hypothetical protein
MVVLIFVCSVSTIFYLSNFLNKVIYLGFNYVILVFSKLEGLFQVYDDVSYQIWRTFGKNIKLLNFFFIEFSSLFFHFENWLKNKLDLSLLITKSVSSLS